MSKTWINRYISRFFPNFWEVIRFFTTECLSTPVNWRWHRSSPFWTWPRNLGFIIQSAVTFSCHVRRVHTPTRTRARVNYSCWLTRRLVTRANYAWTSLVTSTLIIEVCKSDDHLQIIGVTLKQNNGIHRLTIQYFVNSLFFIHQCHITFICILSIDKKEVTSQFSQLNNNNTSNIIAT